MRPMLLFALIVGLSVSTGAGAVEEGVMKQLVVPTGKLRIGVAYAPALTPIFLVKDANGEVRGVPCDLGVALARKRLDFSPPYFVIESTYVASASSDIKTLADVDRPEITVVGINGSTTMRAAGRSLKSAKLVPARSVDEGMAMMKAGSAQAFCAEP